LGQSGTSGDKYDNERLRGKASLPRILDLVFFINKWGQEVMLARNFNKQYLRRVVYLINSLRISGLLEITQLEEKKWR